MAAWQQSKVKVRRFELVDMDTSQFFEIEIGPGQVRTRSGNIGLKGRSKLKSFVSKTDATEYAENLIAGKLEEGYAEANPNAKVKPLTITADRVLVGDYPKELRISGRLSAAYERRFGYYVHHSFSEEDYERARVKGRILPSDLHIEGSRSVETLYLPDYELDFRYVVIENLPNLRELHIESTLVSGRRSDRVDCQYWRASLNWLVCSNLPKLERIVIGGALGWLEVSGCHALTRLDLGHSPEIEHLEIVDCKSLDEVVVTNCRKLRSVLGFSTSEQVHLGVTRQIKKLQAGSKNDDSIYKRMTFTDLDRALHVINSAVRYISLNSLYEEREEKYCGGLEADPKFRKFSIRQCRFYETADDYGDEENYLLNVHTYFGDTKTWVSSTSSHRTPEDCLADAISWVSQVITFPKNLSVKGEFRRLRRYAEALWAKENRSASRRKPDPYFVAPDRTQKSELAMSVAKKHSPRRAPTDAKYTPSPELSEVVGDGPMTIEEARERFLKYVDRHRQRDGADRHVIHPDMTLLPIFGRMFPIRESMLNTLLRSHLFK